MNKKGWIASICIISVAVLFSVLSLFDFQNFTRFVGEYVYLFALFATIAALLILTIFVKKNKLFLIIPIILLFVIGYYFDYLVELNIQDYRTLKESMFASYQTLELILFGAYIAALVFALLKKQKWAAIFVIVYSSIRIFKFVVNPIILIDMDYVLSYLFASVSIILAYVGIIVYFSNNLFKEKNDNVDNTQKSIEE